MTVPNGAQSPLKALRGMGVEAIFASPGSDWAPLWEALASDAYWSGRYVSSRHEETAIAMALGYSKSTGKLPAVVVHTTVGALHTTMIARAALHERIPMVILAGEVIGFAEPPSPKVGRQWLRPAHRSRRPGAPDGAVREVELRAQRARDPAAHHPARLPARHDRAARSGVRVGADRIHARRRAGRKPVIITEEAGRDAATVQALVALAEALGAPVFEAPGAQGSGRRASRGVGASLASAERDNRQEGARAG
ncbi:MAG: thiamine pyrophosphate-binding protein [Betaproteobacteria bacterium]